MYENSSNDDGRLCEFRWATDFNIGVSWVHVGVYFDILLFRIRYKPTSVTYEGLSAYKKVKQFEYKTNKSSLALL